MFYCLDCKRAALTQSRYTAARLRYCRGVSGTAKSQFHHTVQASGAGGVLRVCAGGRHFAPRLSFSFLILLERQKCLQKLWQNSSGNVLTCMARIEQTKWRYKTDKIWSWIELMDPNPSPFLPATKKNICVTKVQYYCNYVRKCYCCKGTECDRNTNLLCLFSDSTATNSTRPSSDGSIRSHRAAFYMSSAS
jgi:hypothetical protein